MSMIRTLSSIFSAALDTVEAFPVAFLTVGGLTGVVAIVIAVVA